MDIKEITHGSIELTEVITHNSIPHLNPEIYESCWQRWKNNAPYGGGEFRDIAVARLLQCLYQQNDSLDLSNLGLSSLPDILPPHIVSLILTQNPLTQLPAHWPDTLQNIWIDSRTLLSIQREETLSAAEHSGPQIHVVTESEAPEQTYPLFDETEAAWLQVKDNGREVRLASERAAAANRRAQSLCQPQTLVKATGILAGLALVGGIGTWLYNRWAVPATDDRAHPDSGNDVAFWQHDGLPDMLPVAQALVSNRINSTEALPGMTLSEAEAIEYEVIKFFMEENGSFVGGKPRKEALIATAAVWLFPTGHPYEPEEKVMKLARKILYAAGRYGGKRNEPLSASLAKAVIRNWVFNTILGAPLQDYIVREIIADKYPNYFTLSSVKHLLSLPKLHAAGLLFSNNVPSAMWGNLNAMWHTFLREEIPVLDDAEYKEAGLWSLADYNFLALSTGAKYLSDLGNIKQFNLSEITSIGASFWGKMTSEGATTDALPYLVTPSLWYFAQTKPGVMQKMLKEKKPWAQIAVLETLAAWKKAVQQSERIEKRLAAYQAAINAWSSKGQLAEKIIARCPLSDILANREDSHYPINERRENWQEIVREQAKQRYMCCNKPPCKRKDVPASLSDEYTKITRNAANAYQKLDKLLLDNIFTLFAKEEAEFISSANTKLSPAYLHMRTHKTPYGGPGGTVHANDIFIETDKADLFSVKSNNEERIYAVKRGEDINSGYTIYRVDRNVNLYIKNGILSHKHLWSNYQLDGEKVLAKGYEFSFSISVNSRTKLSFKKKSSNPYIAYYLSQLHGINFNDNLYAAGYEYSDSEKVWNVVKHIIPFYDCIEGLSSGDSLQIAQALPSCMLDALAFIPLAGQAASLGGKYGMSLAQGIRRGIFKASQGASTAAVAASMSKGIALPTRAQILSLLKNTLRAMDPGFEMLGKSSVLAGRLIADVSDAVLVAKLRNTASIKKVAAKTVYPTAKLPSNGPKVSIKKLENDLYVMVNPQTGEAFGHYYHLKKGALSEVEVRYHLPQGSQPSGSRPKRPKLEPAPDPQQEQAVAIYNQLPPPANNAEYWKLIGILTEQPLDLSLPKKSHTEIQKLECFLPLITPPEDELRITTTGANALISSLLTPHSWRAWTGTDVKSTGDVPLFMQQMQLQLEENIDASHLAHVTVRNKLWSLQHHDNLLETDVGQYLAGILDTYEPAVITEAFKRLSIIVERGDIFLNASKDVNYSNFIIFSTDHTPDPTNPEKFLSPMDKEELINSPFAFVMIPDQEKRIFINAERYQNAYIDNEFLDETDIVNVEADPAAKGAVKKESVAGDTAENAHIEEEAVKEQGLDEVAAKKESDDESEFYEDMSEEETVEQSGPPNYASRLSDDINHEISHITSNTGDMFSYCFPRKGTLHSGQDLLEAFIANFDPSEGNNGIPFLFKQNNFNDIVEQLRTAQGIPRELSHDEVIQAVSTDPMLFANILMHDAEIVSTIIRDLAQGRAFDEIVRFKRDAALEKKADTKSKDYYTHGLTTLIVRQVMSSIYVA